MDLDSPTSNINEHQDQVYDQTMERDFRASQDDLQYSMREFFVDLTKFSTYVRMQSDEQTSQVVGDNHLGMGKIRYNFKTKAGRMLSIENLDMINRVVILENKIVQCYSRLCAENATLEAEIQHVELTEEEKTTGVDNPRAFGMIQDDKAYKPPSWLPALQRSAIRAIAHEATTRYIDRHNLAIQRGEPSKQTAELIREFMAGSYFPNNAEIQLMAEMDPVQTGAGHERESVTFNRIKNNIENRDAGFKALRALRRYKTPEANRADCKAYKLYLQKRRVLSEEKAKEIAS